MHNIKNESSIRAQNALVEELFIMQDRMEFLLCLMREMKSTMHDIRNEISKLDGQDAKHEVIDSHTRKPIS